MQRRLLRITCRCHRLWHLWLLYEYHNWLLLLLRQLQRGLLLLEHIVLVAVEQSIAFAGQNCWLPRLVEITGINIIRCCRCVIVHTIHAGGDGHCLDGLQSTDGRPLQVMRLRLLTSLRLRVPQRILRWHFNKLQLVAAIQKRC